MVANPAIRHPLLLAKDCMTIDHISGGRLTLGVGAGGTRLAHNEDHIDGYRHFQSMARGMGVEFEVLDAAETCRRHPLLTEQGRYEEAVAVYEANLARYPNNGWALHGLAEGLAKLGREEEAADAAEGLADAVEEAEGRRDVIEGLRYGLLYSVIAWAVIILSGFYFLR